jgi:mono/diheme cytochrome c family protein
MRHCLVLTFVLLLGQCSKKLPTASEPDPTGDPVSYATTIQPIFNARCVSCHSASVPLSGVAMQSHAAVMASVGTLYAGPIVVAGNAAASPLVDKIEPGPRFGSRMPQGGSLSSSQISAIRQWIQEGARNN